ncbi:MAG: ThiF family adenylyltransferase [Pyrinomonadaceae bacterium]
MNKNIAQENIRMLASIIGKDMQMAASLLDSSIALVFDPKDLASSQFAGFLNNLLSRTIKSVVNNPAKSEKNTISVLIGNVDSSDGDNKLYVNFDSERIIISSVISKTALPSNVHPILLLLGACYTAAQVIQRIVGDMLPIPFFNPLEINFKSILGDDFSLDSKFDIQTAYLAGAGAIGNGFVLALSLLNPSGKLYIADLDIVDEGNLNRCVWFDESNVGFNKADELVKIAQPKFKTLDLISHSGELQSIPTKNSGAWLRRLIIGVDSRRVRRNLQNEIPGEVYDASTTDIREVVLHFNNQPLNGLACLSCIYFEDVAESAHELHVAEVLGVSLQEVQSNYISAIAAQKICQKYDYLIAGNVEGLAYDSLFKQLCGEGMLKTSEDKQVLAPFSFVSVLAGTYLAIEFAKRIISCNPVEKFNYWRISPWSVPVLRAQKYRHSKIGCDFCGNPIMVETANSLWS